jgi:hypothetical protein
MHRRERPFLTAPPHRTFAPSLYLSTEIRMKSEHHVWIIDVIEENSAAVEVDGRQVTPLPRWLLPEGAREGDVLSVRHERSHERSTLTIEIDRAAAAEALRRSAEQVRSTDVASSDPGGDVVL